MTKYSGILMILMNLASLIKKAERLEMQDCGHLIPIEKPIIFANYINNFAKKLM